jgi:hypothetical protein
VEVDAVVLEVDTGQQHVLLALAQQQSSPAGDQHPQLRHRSTVMRSPPGRVIRFTGSA